MVKILRPNLRDQKKYKNIDPLSVFQKLIRKLWKYRGNSGENVSSYKYPDY
jgi:hypothetical protein